MKKILILSYYYPPANFVGAERIDSFANHLHKFGVYPIIVTRNWNPNQTNTYEKIHENSFKHNVYDTHEEYYMPYEQSWRDKLFQKKSFIFRIVRQLLTLWELLFSAYFIRVLPYHNLCNQARAILGADKEIQVLIISGSPFESFHFGYLLKKEFTNIHWMPSYRDEWTAFKRYPSIDVSQSFFFWYNSFFEKKFTSNASFFITVADYWVESISNYIHKPGILVANGIRNTELEYHLPLYEKTSNEFTIAYSGSIYPNQSFEPLARLLKRLKLYYKDQISIVFNIYGLQKDSHIARQILNDFSNTMCAVNIFSRIPMNELHAELLRADILYIAPYLNLNGFIPVKVYDYFELGRPLFFFPSNGGEIEKFITSTNTGYAMANEAEGYEILSHLIGCKIEGIPSHLVRNKEASWFYSREHQVSILAEKIKSLPPLS
jgi:hypothetical protein